MIDLTPGPFPAREGGTRLRLDKLRLTCIVPPKAARRTVQAKPGSRSLGEGVVRTARFWAIEVR
jgi:hypothetical protein